ncbi:uncharacterized protein LOC125235761 [Leguminivora glycinivorella]|uniref:uncharacterized protein LOC125235761 n=1 Tax=Leguminivora glycinivorella TaxID=1035111 RepID=UPI00200C375B|nr:uncharacterized protein LOC125235761 [Leguminivora glycinivorella]
MATTSENERTPHATFSFDKLDGVNDYLNWKFCMRHALIMEGLWSAVEGTETDTTKIQRALARICLSVKPHCMQHLRTADTAKKAWSNLQQIFEDKGLYRRVVLLRQLHRASYTDYSSMQQYIEAVTTLVQKLDDIGRTTEDAEVAELLLSGLPQEYDVLVSSLEAASLTKTLTSEMVRARLLQEEFRRTTIDSDKANAALFTKTTSKKIICSYCKKPNHHKSKCFKFKRDKKNSDSVQHGLTVSALAAYSSEDWIVDSGCTNSM